MNNTVLDDNALNILSIVGDTPQLSQRALADQSGLSLGLVNLILQRLIKTGHIKIANLNQKKVHYFLTRKGFFKKTKQTSSYISKTVKTFLEYESRLRQILEELIKQGHRNFAIQGEGEILRLVKIALQSIPSRASYRILNSGEKQKPNEFLLDCRLNETISYDLGVSILAKMLEKR